MNRINLICLGVRDMARSLAFYKALGFKTHETGAAPPIVFFDTSGTKLELYPLAQLAKDISEDALPPTGPGAFPGITLAINCKSEAEVDALMALALQSGGTAAKPPQKVFWGGYSGYFRDPDGYYWEVAFGPNWQFDENDMLILD